MYADRLTTPHPELRQGNAGEPLLDSKAFKNIQDTYQDSCKSRSDRERTADECAGLVKKTLRFADQTPDAPLMSSETIENWQIGNCYAHTIVLSDVLNEIDIPHYIGFANQHAFTVVGTPDTGLYLADGQIPFLNAPLDTVLSNIEGIEPQITEMGRASTFLNTEELIGKSRYRVGVHLAAEQYPWLMFNRQDGRMDQKTSPERKNSTRIVINLYEPEVGQKILENYNDFKHSWQNGRDQRALTRLDRLGRLYPDTDRRNSLTEVEQLLSHLALNNQFAAALDVIESVSDSFRPSQDPATLVWRPDQYRYLGVRTGEPELIEIATKQYLSLRNLGRLSLNKLVDPRLKKARSTLRQFGLAHDYIAALAPYPQNNRSERRDLE